MIIEHIGDATLYTGDVLECLRELADESVHCVVTSPPYWGLRDYGIEGQIGLERTPQEYVARMVEVFREVRRVLRADGTVWLNLGDCYTGSGKAGNNPEYWGKHKEFGHLTGANPGRFGYAMFTPPPGLKRKELVGIPWRVAFALQADGWYLRSDIIWSKPNPMPESVTDRPTKSHEYIFLLTKAARYWYDAEAIKEEVTGNAHARGDGVNPKARARKTPDGWDTSRGNGGHGSFHREGRERGRVKQNPSFSAAVHEVVSMRNRRTVWTIATQPYPEAHFATFPEKLVEPCILAGCPEGGTLLDPFCGSGTALQVALRLGRRAVGIELKTEYMAMTRKRIAAEAAQMKMPLGEQA